MREREVKRDSLQDGGCEVCLYGRDRMRYGFTGQRQDDSGARARERRERDSKKEARERQQERGERDSKREARVTARERRERDST